MAQMKRMDVDAESLELLRRLSSLGLIAFDRKADSVSVNPVVLSIFREQGLAGQVTPAGTERHLSTGQDRRTNENVAQAKAVLGGQTTAFDEMVKLAKWLKGARYFGYARQMFARTRTLPEANIRKMPNGTPYRLWLGQQHALCTYKDPDLPTVEKLDRALEILQEVDDLPTTRDQETLGLAGSTALACASNDNWRAAALSSPLYWPLSAWQTTLARRECPLCWPATLLALDSWLQPAEQALE